MAESDKNEIFMSPAPHVITPVNTSELMFHVIIALCPIALYGIYLFSIPALVRIIVSIVCCAGFEALFRVVVYQDVKSIRIKDCSSIVTGLLLAMVVPPAVPIWMLILGCFFAVIVAKEFFGGLGANPFNPALVGRAFMFISFSVAMTSWTAPAHLMKVSATASATASATTALSAAADAVSSATPLSMLKIKEGAVMSAGAIADKLDLGTVPQVYRMLLLGEHAGCIGETCVFLILLGFIYLVVQKVIDWKTPVAMILTTVGITSLAGIDPLLTLLSGGLVFGAVFMATDYVTTPVTAKGRVLFGIGCGLITALVRLFSGMPEGVMYSILIMNTVVPFLNKLIQRKYGFVKPQKKAK